METPKFVNVKLKRETVEDMISTYTFLFYFNTGEEKNIVKQF